MVLLKNARIENGFKKINEQIIKTETKIVDIRVIEERVTEINSVLVANDQEEVIDLKGELLVPSMREMHVHIDKTYFGGEWKACRPMVNGLQTRIEEEEWLLPEQYETAPERAEKVIRHYIANGHRHIRTHTNIDPVMGTRQLEAILPVLEKYAPYITYDIVAFPQHGLLRSNSVELVREALKKGATHVGGVDPSLLDRNVDQSIDTIFELAVSEGKKIDVHLHARDSLGAYEFNKFIAYTKKYEMQGKVTLSHAMALGDLTHAQVEPIAKAFAENGIDLASTIPIRNTTMPIHYLHDLGVKVSVGHDSLTDHWSPFGSGDTIEKLNMMAQRFSISDEYRLSRLLQFATNDVLPLSDIGNQVWPKIGDLADFFTTDSECTAHLIARKRPINHVFLKGKLISVGGKINNDLFN